MKEQLACMEHYPSSSSSSSSSHWIPKPILHVNINHVYHLVFFIIGISLGLVTALHFKTFSVPLQYFLTYHIAPPSISLSHQPLPLPPPLSPPPDSAVLAVYNTTSRTTKMSLMHNMTDQELFMEAIKVRGVQGLHENTNPKVAFMFLAKGALPFAPLWERFFKGHEGFYNIYLHQQPSFNETVPQDSVFYGRKIPSQPVFWGTSSMVDAERRLLANALLDDISNKRFVLLSESCIPLFNFKTTYSYLTNSSLSFLGCFDDPKRSGRGRYSPNMQPTINLTNWRKGSQWFELHRDLALAVVSDSKYYPILQKHCVPPYCFMDEHYMPTFVHMMYSGMNSNRSVTWADWSKRGPHPRMFGGDDVSEEFLNGIRFGTKCVYNGNVSTNVCFLFARKFHPNALEPLLRVAPVLLGIDP